MNQRALFLQAFDEFDEAEYCPVLAALRLVEEPEEIASLPPAFAAPRGFIRHDFTTTGPQTRGAPAATSAFSELGSAGFRAPRGFLP